MPRFLILLFLFFIASGCLPASFSTPEPAPAIVLSFTPKPVPHTSTPSPLPPTQTATATPTPIPVDSLKAKVSADKIICRYGPGKNYLYLIAFNKTTPVRLIGRTEGRSDWILVENGQQDCWVDSNLLEVKDDADPQTLRIVYPNEYKIPVSPYYGPTSILSATRDGDQVKVNWSEVIVSPGKYEDVNMFPYIVEVWYCKDGEIIFDTLGSRVPNITLEDQAGCNAPSHGRVFIQEKHGFAGPVEIPWPAR